MEKQTLPPISQQASEKPATGEEIKLAYPDAIEFITNRSEYRGIMFPGICAALSFVGLAVWACLFTIIEDRAIDGYFFMFFVMIFVALAMAIFAARVENFTYFDRPVLFNRATQKVHVFSVKPNWKKPFSWWPAEIKIYDWNCIRATVVGTMSGTTSAPNYRCSLVLEALASPEGGKAIDAFVVGHSLTSNPLNRMAAWEHIRRYMQGTGVALLPRDKLHDEILTSPWAAFWSIIVPKTTMGKVFAWILPPLTLIRALGSALVVLTGKPALWTPDIYSAAGDEPLSEEAIRKQVEDELKKLPSEGGVPEHEKWA